MSLYETSLLTLMRRLGRLGLDEWYEGTVTSGGSTSIADTSRYEEDDFFQSLTPKARARITSTTDGLAPYGQERTITDWVQSTGAATVHAAWTTSNPAAGDTYVFLSKYTWAELKEAINDAIDQAGDDGLVEKIDETIVLAASVYEYPVPSGFVFIYRVSMANDDGTYSDTIPPDQYRIVRAGDVPKIHFSRFPTSGQHEGHYYSDLWADGLITAGRTLRIEGLSRQPVLDKETDVCYINPEYVWHQAAATLHSKRIRSAENDPDEHRVQFALHQARADELKKSLFYGLLPNSKRVVR